METILIISVIALIASGVDLLLTYDRTPSGDVATLQ
jgi:hypothetical protein